MTPRRKRVVRPTTREPKADGSRRKYDAAAVMAVVCDQHGEHGRYLHDIAALLTAQGMPLCVKTIKRYAKLPEYAEDWQDAKEAHADWQARRMTAVIGANRGDAQIARLFYDDAKWKAAHADWRAYGDKLDVTTAGERIPPGVMLLPAESWGRATDEADA